MGKEEHAIFLRIKPSPRTWNPLKRPHPLRVEDSVTLVLATLLGAVTKCRTRSNLRDEGSFCSREGTGERVVLLPTVLRTRKQRKGDTRTWLSPSPLFIYSEIPAHWMMPSMIRASFSSSAGTLGTLSLIDICRGVSPK